MAGPSRRRFEQVYRDGKRASGRFLRVHALPGEGLVGVAAPRALGSIARRNRQRRRLRAISSATPLPAGFDWIVAATRAVEEATWPELLSEAARLVREASLRWAVEPESR